MRLRALDPGERRAVDFFACGRFCAGFLAVVLARAEVLPLLDAAGLRRDEDLRAAAPADLRAVDFRVVLLRPRDAGDLARALVADFFFAAAVVFFAFAPRFAPALEERFFLAAIIPPFLDC